jgi:hypothetical protein
MGPLDYLMNTLVRETEQVSDLLQGVALVIFIENCLITF